jgi:hypothetical protein
VAGKSGYLLSAGRGLDRNAPIAVAFDFNANINWLVAGLGKAERSLLLNGFYV